MQVMSFDNTHSLTAILRSLDRITNQGSLVYGNGSYSMNTLQARGESVTNIAEWRAAHSVGDATRIKQLQEACIAFQSTKDPPPENVFKEDTINMIRTLQRKSLINSQKWLVGGETSGNVRNVDHVKYFPAIAYLQNQLLAGFEYLSFKLGDRLSREYKLPIGEFDQGPTLAEEGSSYYTFYASTSMAMLVKSINDIHTPAVKNLHIICKGYGEFNKDGKIPEDSTGELLPWCLDTFDTVNLEPFVESVMKCPAFLAAAQTPSNGQPLRRIMVWLLERSHFEQFGWDTLYDSSGNIIKHILFMVSTVPGVELWGNPQGHTNILNEFKQKLIRDGHIDAQATTLIPDLKCRAALRKSANKFDDIWCVLFAGFSTPILANVLDIESWDGGDGMDSAYWDFCRAGYHRFETGMLERIASTIQDKDNTLWICPQVAAAHLNIKDVYLLAAKNGTQNKKIEFSWKTGWYETSL